MNYTRLFKQYIFTLICILTLNFIIPRLMPGDPFNHIGDDENSISQVYSQEDIDRYKAYYGLDKPIHIQYKDYMVNLLKGDIGYSIYYKDSVLNVIIPRLIWTLGIVMVSLTITVLLGIILGCISAYNRNSIVDKLLYLITVSLSEIPAFLIGIFLLFFVARNSQVLPLSGGKTVFGTYNSLFELVKDLLVHGFLPVIALVLSRLGGFYLLTRNSMISVLGKDYMQTAKAKGLSQKRIIFIHALKNAIIPIINRIFLSIGGLFSGAILVEAVFKYPGIGQITRQSIMVRDYPLIQGIFLFITLMVLIMNLLADIVHKKIDPRVT